ncbi:MAG: hypothetical protein A3G52_03985 [Candidatus Taylorbacteria bacterium RIFCSPLOWO2_12_FULL_43_20]|uniref:Uncharacterized protein n=1 Tax=Candidatus Taylorbacteria bacterium RIFCSPLOWO2_12_FULL_43_20 TaxID=1802332 RepID=A0A1G2P0A1_9BACT|nr:MAG: hypothetical protein A2825_00885 [Candidatus Taylorbacteria bacterium RIFCSPHIGHO2_01_FULL_43_120]OHA22902.1 MAG: hypothetical protein A3B98_03690 [Candidatus Taylorbacteria bacterium RIFCSPHIGHO2_02_FULL_43_55]OHA29999.1 MAG: hypothetical protein A3E92_04145 [Candidatus Taylorbacteria bacterium RIFCSPHIGHO2_12_FULL_42_34]OHA30819.1 MAG: hypothetical protein A3B09_01325 [Candidatus Taylorbacteria bacterium RIFCSPLOWO2_01_FULL_43_83]OHA39109.1 MAG: hypothetical protein A3H58_00020 [Candi
MRIRFPKKKSSEIYCTKDERYPGRDWMRMMIFFGVLNLSILGASYYFFLGIAKDRFFSEEAGGKESLNLLDKESILWIEDDFDIKRERFNELGGVGTLNK